jgi:putative DNA primase/helicase
MPAEVIQQGGDVIFPHGDLTLLVSGARSSADGVRASITVRRGADILARDVVPLWSAQRRKRFAETLNGGSPDDLDQLLLRIEDALRAMIRDRQAKTTEADPQEIPTVSDVEPWDVDVDGATLLDEIVTTLQRFLALPAHAAEAIALWIVASHELDCFEIFPLLAITSPTKRCGKTTLLGILARLLRRALPASNITTAALFRVIQQHRPSLLIDEADTFVHGNDELRGVINSGHSRPGAFVLRVEGEGENRQVERFSTWCPRVLAQIGAPPDTIEDRAIVLTMRRRAKDEKVERARARTLHPLRDLARKVARWTADHHDDLALADPYPPEDLDDRAQDNWLPLFAVADLAGGPWPDRARRAALALSAGRDVQDDEIGTRMLRNIKQVFDGRAMDRLSSMDLVSALTSDDEWGWNTLWKGKGLDQRKLARVLAAFSIGPRCVRIGDSTPRGYHREQFLDSWSRYLAFCPQHPQQANDDATLDSIFDPQQGPDVADTKSGLTTDKHYDVADVADKKQRKGHQTEMFASNGWAEV